ncbi:hypothetical protein C5167_026462 [Papaver somniferum]|nr:hypothetical protein C5167_026462 [Papaver somniferum]
MMLEIYQVFHRGWLFSCSFPAHSLGCRFQEFLGETTLVYLLAVLDGGILAFCMTTSMVSANRDTSSSSVAPELMESESSSAQNGGRTTWTPPMDELLIELMVEQVLKKQLLDGQFSKCAWETIITKFKESFGPFNKDVLRNRMKTLKKIFNVASSIRGQSGFGWNKKKEIPTAPDDVWERHIKHTPNTNNGGQGLFHNMMT